MIKAAYSATNIQPPSSLIVINRTLYFVVDDEEHGAELWKLEQP
jgi:hypothetical protein